MLEGGRLPFFSAWSERRIRRIYLEPQPDDNVPRFDYEGHMAALTGEPPSWPESTYRLAQLRLTIEFEPQSFVKRRLGQDKLRIDIVDYPGEWLLDVGLMDKSFDDWARGVQARWELRESEGAQLWRNALGSSRSRPARR